MKLSLIRNATILIEFGDKRILIDPYFSPKSAKTNKSPIVDLPYPAEEIIKGIDMVLVSHLHTDHFDKKAQELLPKSIPLYCQPSDASRIHDMGFINVSAIDETIAVENIQINRINGHHGLGDVEKLMGKVSGFVIQAPDEPRIYWCGDTVLCDEVKEAIQQYSPDVVITHSCGAKWPDQSGNKQVIIMDEKETIAVAKFAPDSVIIATHMDALSHCTLSRAGLRKAADDAGISEVQLLIPGDGQTIEIT